MNRLHFNMLLRVSLLHSETEKVINIETPRGLGIMLFGSPNFATFTNVFVTGAAARARRRLGISGF